MLRCWSLTGRNPEATRRAQSFLGFNDGALRLTKSSPSFETSFSRSFGVSSAHLLRICSLVAPRVSPALAAIPAETAGAVVISFTGALYPQEGQAGAPALMACCASKRGPHSGQR